MKKASGMRKWAKSASAWRGLALAASVFVCAEAQAAGPGDAAPDSAESAPTPAKPVKHAAKTAPRASGASSEMAGRYSVLREAGKDTGCMLTLDAKPGAHGNKASLAPGCRDQGIVIFDPVGWQIGGGRLTLTARKGHSTHLDQQPDGTWLKDPKEGKGLSLKKM
ncbi:AprI/Inh family metalloprotease inhibitor [Methylocapsa acidiphila]|uniref:AprI/Inh family metalloprotease inhibitor n=1 Tax=Methylocapsa acidiphila TaxID=133552 RepID=UPI001FDA5F60|nr:AprI/Inh family metalloprotease inhibitor [Methylocapsa acidiphila]